MQAGRPRQIDVGGGDQWHQQTLGLRGVVREPCHRRGQARVLSRRQAGGEFVLGQAVAGNSPFEQLERQGLRPARGLHLVDVARSPFAQQWAMRQIGPGDAWQVRPCGTNPAQGIARQRQPGQARQFGQPAGHLAQAVGRYAQQFQLVCRLQAVGQCGELVARQHQLLQSRALAEFGGQMADGVVRQCQPTQCVRQRGGRHMGNPVGLEADHVQRRAIAQHFGQHGEVVV